MRARALLAALALVAAPLAFAPSSAYADGIERPRQRPPVRRPPPPPSEAAAAPVIIPQGPETVTLSDSFLASASGGVGADVGVGGGYYSSTTVVIRGGARAHAAAFASARASAGVGVRGGFGGRRGGRGCGCR